MWVLNRGLQRRTRSGWQRGMIVGIRSSRKTQRAESQVAPGGKLADNQASYRGPACCGPFLCVACGRHARSPRRSCRLLGSRLDVMKVLWISQNVPYPPKSGVLLRNYNLIRLTSRFAAIDLVAIVKKNAMPSSYAEMAVPELLKLCSTVQPVRLPAEESRFRLWWALLKSLVHEGAVHGELGQCTGAEGSAGARACGHGLRSRLLRFGQSRRLPASGDLRCEGAQPSQHRVAVVRTAHRLRAEPTQEVLSCAWRQEAPALRGRGGRRVRLQPRRVEPRRGTAGRVLSRCDHGPRGEWCRRRLFPAERRGVRRARTPHHGQRHELVSEPGCRAVHDGEHLAGPCQGDARRPADNRRRASATARHGACRARTRGSRSPDSSTTSDRTWIARRSISVRCATAAARD